MLKSFLCLLLFLPSVVLAQFPRSPYSTAGPNTMLVMGAKWPGHDPVIGPGDFDALADSVASHSRGVMTLTVSILPMVEIATPSDPCTDATRQAVYDAARAMGTNPDDYDYKVVVIPPSVCGSFAGSAGAQEFILYSGTSVGLLIHEMKHAMGLAHERHYECYDPASGLPTLFDPHPGACTWEGGDVTSGGAKAPSPPQQEYLGWIEPQEVLQTSVVRLLPYEQYPSVVKVRGEYGGRYYYYQFALRKGKVEVYLSCWFGTTGWYCTVNGYLGTLPLGRMFTDPGDFGTEYTVTEITPTHATLLVNLHDIVKILPTTWGRIKARYR